MLKKEIDGDPDDTAKPSPVLQDVYYLAQAYYTSTPPDYLNCAWYATRAAAFAPAAYKTTIEPLATYCYKKYHGSADGYAAMQTAVQTNLDPPAGFTVTPAPKPEDLVAQLVATTPDLATLALGDKETALQYGKPADAQKVFDSVKGKAVEFPGVTVVSATDSQLVLEVSDDAVASKTPDFTVNMKEPLKTIPQPGEKAHRWWNVRFLYGFTADDYAVGRLPGGAEEGCPVHHTVHHSGM